MYDKFKFVNYKPSTITFYNQDRDLLLKESSLLAVSTETNHILAIGEEAQIVVGNAAIGSPFRNGIVADFELARKMLRMFLAKANGLRLFTKPKIAVCVPVDMTQVEYQALNELILSIGGRSVLIIDKPFEVAIKAIPRSYKIIIEILPETCASSNV